MLQRQNNRKQVTTYCTQLANMLYKQSVHPCTFEVSDTVSQFPPVKENFPDPIRSRISSGVSLGPLANGVYLKETENRG